MKQNPCRYCEHAYVNKGNHTPGNAKECYKCEKYKKHQEYLESKRMFVPGEPITDIAELLKQDWVMWHWSIKHIELFKSMQLRTVLMYLELGAFRKAIEKESEEKDGDKAGGNSV